MDSKTFSNIISVSSRGVETAHVNRLRDSSNRILKKISSKKGLYLISGLRGIGKTTILSEISHQTKKSVYINGEAVVKHGADLLDVLHQSEKSGYSTFLIDEIHTIPNWEKDVKIFYDEFHPNMVVTGSSAAALKLKGSELSRRATNFNLKPLSFREYLEFKTGGKIKKLMISDILNHNELVDIMKTISPHINEFDEYVKRNALPACFFENKPDAYVNILERIVRYDLLSLREIDLKYVDDAFKVIKFIATSPPGEFSYSKLGNSLNLGTKVVQNMVKILSYSGLLYIIPPEGVGHKTVRGEDKILMPLSFRNVLCKYYGIQTPVGGIREDFFAQHVDDLKYLKTGVTRRTPDYLFKDYVFEVGGPSKGWEQLKNRKKAYLVRESLMFSKNEIPLYAFGFLY